MDIFEDVPSSEQDFPIDDPEIGSDDPDVTVVSEQFVDADTPTVCNPSLV